jgi:hypothetical protein
MRTRSRAYVAWNVVIAGGLVLLALVVLFSANAPRRAGEQNSAAVVASPVFIEHESSEGDPPLELKFQESHAKKPRLKALLVHTVPTADSAHPLAFHLHSADNAPAPRSVAPPTDPTLVSRRDDPVLRLHPGQAPPHTA